MKKLLVEHFINCPNCDHDLNVGDTMYDYDDRGDVVCGYCKEDYLEEIRLSEGEDGRLLK